MINTTNIDSNSNLWGARWAFQGVLYNLILKFITIVFLWREREREVRGEERRGRSKVRDKSTK